MGEGLLTEPFSPRSETFGEQSSHTFLREGQSSRRGVLEDQREEDVVAWGDEDILLLPHSNPLAIPILGGQADDLG